MGINDIDDNILLEIQRFSVNEEVVDLAIHVASYIHKISAANTLTPTEVLALIYLVNATINTEVAEAFDEYINEFFVRYSDEEEEETPDPGTYDLDRDHNTFPYGMNHGPDDDYPEQPKRSYDYGGDG
jgi:hypothetical protein